MMRFSPALQLILPILFVAECSIAQAPIPKKPTVTPWEYYFIQCDYIEHGPYSSDAAAAAAGAAYYYPNGTIESSNNWGTPQNFNYNSVCVGSSVPVPRFPWDYQYGVEVYNIKGTTVNPNNGTEQRPGVAVRSRRSASCPNNASGNSQSCTTLSLIPEKNLTQSCFKNPISLETGNKTETVVDYSGPGNLDIQRVYHSALGEWRFDFETFIEQGANGVVYVTHPNGEISVFTWTNGAYVGYADSSARLVREPISGPFTGWKLTEENGEILRYDAWGRLIQKVFRHGQTHSYGYDSVKELNTITNDAGQSLLVDWYQGDVSRIEAPDGMTYVYGYDSNNNLTSRNLEQNAQTIATVTYHYEDTNFPKALTGITDENNVRYATWTYDSAGRANSAQHTNGVDYGFVDYTYLDDPTDSRITVTNEFGKQTTYHFQIIGGERKKILVEGHQSQNCDAANKSYTYYPSGLLKTKTDWKGNTTYYEYNADGLESKHTEAYGTLNATEYLSYWNADTHSKTWLLTPQNATELIYDTSDRLITQKYYSQTDDSDNDGLFDYAEAKYFGGLQFSSSDDYDQDGVDNQTEINAGLDPTNDDPDIDGDGLHDLWEIDNFSNLNQTGANDFDNDGLSNAMEWLIGTNPTNASDNADSDNDLLPDVWEQYFFGNLDQNGEADFDNDWLSNVQEFEGDTNPKLSNLNSPHRYWRLTNLVIPGTYFEIGDIELSLIDQTGLNSQATFTTATAPLSGAVANIVDNNSSTRAYWNSSDAMDADFYLQWDFGSAPQAVMRLRQAGFDNATRYLQRFTLSYSDDGVNWTEQKTSSGLAYPGNYAYSGYYEVEQLPPSYGAASHRYWRLTDLLIPDTYFEVGDLQLALADETGSNNQAVFTTATSPLSGSISNVVDDVPTTRAYWYAAAAMASNFYLQWDFGSSPQPISLVRQAGFDVSTRYLLGFTLEYSDDGTNWTAHARLAGLSYPGNHAYSPYYDVSQPNYPSPSPGEGSGEAHSYWRLVNLKVANTYFEIGDIELVLSDNTGLNNAAVFSASSTPMSGSANNIADNNPNTRAYWHSTVAMNPAFFLKWDFSGNPKAVTKLRQAGYDNANRFLRSFTLEYSDDGVTWFPQSKKSDLDYPGNFTYSSYYDVNQ